MATAIADLKDENVKMYPNPSSGMITIELDGSMNDLPELMIVNAMGQILRKIKLTEVTSVVDINQAEAGIYQVILVADGKMIWKSLLSKY